MNEDEISVISLQGIYLPKKYEDSKNRKKQNLVEKDVSYWNVSYLLAILAFCTLFTSLASLIPRSNSIFYQTRWFEFNLAYGIFLGMSAGNHLLNMITFFNEKSLQSLLMFLRLYVFMMIIWIVPYLVAYVIWCNFLGYNWPIPYLGYNFFVSRIIITIGLRNPR